MMSIGKITLKSEELAQQRNIRASAELLRRLHKHHDLANVARAR